MNVHGTPREIGPLLRRALRPVQLAIGIPATLALWWFEAWWWLPAPLAGAFLVGELMIASRLDRPITVALGADRVRLLDPPRAPLEVAVADVVGVSVLTRRLADGTRERLILLVGQDDVALALHLVGEAPLEAGEVDLDAEAALGGVGHLGRSTAPRERTARQIIRDDRVLDWLRATFPPERRQRLGVRVWRGAQPALDLFGYHEGAPDGWLEVDQDRLALQPHASARDPSRCAARRSVVASARLARSTRTATLIATTGASPEHIEDLPMLVLELRTDADVVRIALPAPAVPEDLPPVPLADDVLHVHAAQGAILLAHFRTVGVLTAGRDLDRWSGR